MDEVKDNSNYVCYEVDASYYIEQNRHIEVMENVLFYENGTLNKIFKGPVTINLEGYRKKGKSVDYHEYKAYYINNNVISKNRVTDDLSIKVYDFLYKILIQMHIKYTYKNKIINYESLVSLLSPKKNIITNEYINKITKPILVYSIKRNILSVVKDKKISLLDSPKYLSEIKEKICIEVNNKIQSFGMQVELILESVDFVDDTNTSELNSILFKQKEMKALNYTYQEENLIDYLEFVNIEKEDH